MAYVSDGEGPIGGPEQTIQRFPSHRALSVLPEGEITMSAPQSAPKLADLLSGSQLPALPQSAIRLLELSQDPENGPAEFAVPIEADAGLTGQVLRFVNSSYFGFSREISSVKLAITLVGVRTVKNFALWSAVFSLMPNPRCGPFDLKSLWQDSLRRGIFARRMGRLLGLSDSEDLFAAALLQDMAVPILAKQLPREYNALLDQQSQEGVRLSKLERERFGWTHAEAGGVIARGWRLPEEFATLIEKHPDLDELLAAGDAAPGPLIVSLSALLPSVRDAAWRERAAFLTTLETLAPNHAATLSSLLERVEEDFEEFAPALQLSVPSTSLAAALAEDGAAPA